MTLDIPVAVFEVCQIPFNVALPSGPRGAFRRGLDTTRQQRRE